MGDGTFRRMNANQYAKYIKNQKESATAAERVEMKRQLAEMRKAEHIAEMSPEERALMYKDQVAGEYVIRSQVYENPNLTAKELMMKMQGWDKESN
jgi:hypothetical protein